MSLVRFEEMSNNQFSTSLFRPSLISSSSQSSNYNQLRARRTYSAHCLRFSLASDEQASQCCSVRCGRRMKVEYHTYLAKCSKTTAATAREEAESIPREGVGKGKRKGRVRKGWGGESIVASPLPPFPSPFPSPSLDSIHFHFSNQFFLFPFIFPPPSSFPSQCIIVILFL